MIRSFKHTFVQSAAVAMLSMLPVLTTGCEDETVKTYTVPKSTASPAATNAPQAGAQRSDAPGTPATATNSASQPQLPPGHPPVDLTQRPAAPAPGTSSPQIPGITALPPAPSAASAASSTARPSITYKLPSGWTDRTQPGGMRVASLLAGTTDDAPQVSVIPLGGGGGSPLDNVNRWRQQVGLEPIDQAGFEQQTRVVTVGGHAGYYVQLVGPQQSILAAGVPIAGTTWFIKMQGPADAVAPQREAFDALLASITFTDTATQ
jgi:hypothetical protein